MATALLVAPGRGTRDALVEIVSRGVQGDDMVALTALACRRVGGKAWETFRAAAANVLGSQQLSGSVIVLVNSLAGGHLPLVAEAK